MLRKVMGFVGLNLSFMVLAAFGDVCFLVCLTFFYFFLYLCQQRIGFELFLLVVCFSINCFYRIVLFIS